MSIQMIVIILLVLSYPIVAAITLRLAGATRLEFADNIRILLQDPDISEDHKVFISSMADDLFDWQFMAWATLAFPKAAFSRKGNSSLTKSDKSFFCRSDVQRLMDLHLKSVMAASPAFTVIFVVVAVITIVCIIVFFGLSLISVIWADTVKKVSPNVGRPIATHQSNRH